MAIPTDTANAMPTSDLTSDTSKATGESAQMQLALVNLLCSLESIITEASGEPRGERVDAAATTARKMLVLFVEFVDEFFSDNEAETTSALILQASNACEVHEEILRNRSWTNTIKCILKADRIDEDALITNQSLGSALVRVINAIADQTCKKLPEGQLVTEFRQSVDCLVQELEQSW